jgi:hypothetical protein
VDVTKDTKGQWRDTGVFFQYVVVYQYILLIIFKTPSILEEKISKKSWFDSGSSQFYQ